MRPAQESLAPMEEEDHFDSEIKVTAAGRVYPKCSICAKTNSRYKCPGCTELTCSVYCSRKHKKRTGCSGVRSNTVFIPKGEYEQTHSKRDYEYLISMIDNIDKVKKGLTGVSSYSHSHDQKSFKLLKKYGRQMYQIDLRVGPYVMEKHRENISFFFVKTNQFYWVFQLDYMTPDWQIEKITTQPTCDHLPVKELFKQEKVSTALLTKHQINTARTQQFHVLIRNRYRYGFLPPDSHAIDKKDYAFIQVSLSDDIVDIVKGLVVYEFPTLFVVHRTLISQFCQKNKTSLLQATQDK